MKKEKIIKYPIGDTIDLHTFRPGEVKELLHDYLEAAAGKGFEQVRIVHGKGSGTLRQLVHAVLARSPMVISYKDAGHDAGGWGATIALLKNNRRA